MYTYIFNVSHTDFFLRFQEEQTPIHAARLVTFLTKFLDHYVGQHSFPASFWLLADCTRVTDIVVTEVWFLEQP